MTKYLLAVFFSFCFLAISAQERTLTGILEDKGEPILFATVAIYRNDILIRGVETNLNGQYAIECMVGDKIEFSYIGYNPKSTIVTEAMLSGPNSAPRQSIERIISKAFNHKMKDRKLKALGIYNNDIHDSNTIASLSNKYLLNQPAIDFSVKNGKIVLTKPTPAVKYDLGITQNIGLRSVASWHQHKLQNTYSQGRPINGMLKYRDHSTGESHSFGPKILDLNNQEVYANNNNLLQPSVTLGTKVFFEAECGDQKIYSIIDYNSSKDIFNKYRFNETNIRLGYIKFERNRNSDILSIDLNINRTGLGNHNYNGYYQKALQSMMIQSPNFDSESQPSENNESFSPKFNHPEWYLNNNNNPVQSDAINLAVSHKWKSPNAKSEISNLLNLEYRKTQVAEYIHKSTIGNTESNSNIFNAKIPSALLVSKFKRKRFGLDNITLELDNIAALAKTEFLGKTNNEITYNQSDNLLRNTCIGRVEYQSENLKFAISNNSLLANNQPSSFLNPAAYFSYDFKFKRKKISKLRPYIGVNRITKEQDLLLDRYNYSSLLYSHHELQSQNLNAPLWLSNNLKNEIKDEYKIGIIAAKRYSNSTFKSALEYKYMPQQNVIFPVLENGDFVLKNAVDFTTHQITWKNSVEGSKYIWNKRFGITNTFEIIHFNTKVNKIHTSSNKISIAGFRDISKNLIVGQPVGVIVGSDYNRTEKGDVIIGQNGFPTKAKELKIIADPTPLFNFKYDLELYVNHFFFKIYIDGQIGGKVWNGTQQTLDYYGVSQHSADQRTIDNYIFEGVQSDGSKNTKQVALADPEQGLEGNQWNRYGANGIASVYIKSASHISLKSIELSYWDDNYSSSYKITLYAKNLLTLASFDGFTSSYLFEDSMSYGLQYFNHPIATEIGTSLTYNF